VAEEPAADWKTPLIAWKPVYRGLARPGSQVGLTGVLSSSDVTGSSTPTGSVNQTRAKIYSSQSIGSRESSPRRRKIGELVADLLANGFASPRASGSRGGPTARSP
jgi:hypothetical protein